jgi:hypothetical protein
MYSRRGFFDHIRRVAEEPRLRREKRVAELCRIGLEALALDCSDDQREDSRRAIEIKLACLDDEALWQPNLARYVIGIVRTKEMFFAAKRAEEDYLRRMNQNPYSEETHE